MYQNLPFDDEHGPYPVIVFIHGTAAFRQYFSHIVEHWVSRGFVVVACDYPGITMADELRKLEGVKVPKTDQAGDTRTVLDALNSQTNPGKRLV
jgi:predicted dienelactone hydrolase